VKVLKHVSYLFQDIALNETDFDQRRNINKRKKLIIEGRNTDVEEAMREKAKQRKTRSKSGKRKRKIEKRKKQRQLPHSKFYFV
jgi:hypothetical protein